MNKMKRTHSKKLVLGKIIIILLFPVLLYSTMLHNEQVDEVPSQYAIKSETVYWLKEKKNRNKRGNSYQKNEVVSE